MPQCTAHLSTSPSPASAACQRRHQVLAACQHTHLLGPAWPRPGLGPACHARAVACTGEAPMRLGARLGARMLQVHSKPRKVACILNKAAESPSTSPFFRKNCALFILAIQFLRFSPASGAFFPCGQCKYEGFLSRTAKFVTNRASCASDDKVIDLTKFPTVCDLTCCPVSDHLAYTHKLVDCMVPSLLTLHKAMLHRDVAKAVIIPDYLADFRDINIRFRLSSCTYRNLCCWAFWPCLLPWQKVKQHPGSFTCGTQGTAWNTRGKL